MPKARYLAPWHQPDLMAAVAAVRAAGGDGLSEAELAALRGKPAIYHCISRVVDRRFVLGPAEREEFVRLMRLYECFCQVRVLAFCVMSNHFHLLVEVPAAPAGRGADWSDERLLEHLGGLYPARKLGEIRWQLAHYRAQGNHSGAVQLRERYFRRMWDLSQFMKTLKQRFARWFNRGQGRKGTMWEERFKSVLVEDGHAARTMAAYIDLNPVRAGMVAAPQDYRWNSYGQATAGRVRAREGLQRVMFEWQRRGGEQAGAGVLTSWRQAADGYRRILEAALARGGPARQAPMQSVHGTPPSAATGLLSEVEALRCRVRHFTDGLALGSQGFIDGLFRWTRNRFGPRRRNGPRRLRHIDTPLRTLRDLRTNTLGMPN